MPRIADSRHSSDRSVAASAGRLAPLALAGLVAAGLVAGCAERVRWVNPEVPQDQWSMDRNACRQQAEELAARQLDNDLASDRMAGTASSLSTQLAVQDAKQLRQRLYERCLGARGYERRSD
jgi:hypothetical protein